jgi:hypothetical protein
MVRTFPGMQLHTIKPCRFFLVYVYPNGVAAVAMMITFVKHRRRRAQQRLFESSTPPHYFRGPQSQHAFVSSRSWFWNTTMGRSSCLLPCLRLLPVFVDTVKHSKSKLNAFNPSIRRNPRIPMIVVVVLRLAGAQNSLFASKPVAHGLKQVAHRHTQDKKRKKNR